MAVATCSPMRATAPQVGLQVVVVKANCVYVESVESEYVALMLLY